MNKKSLTALFTLILASTYTICSELKQIDFFLEWKQKHGYRWSAQEDSYRRLIFQLNVQIIENHNKDQTRTYKTGINQFTGLTVDEFKLLYLMPQITPNKLQTDNTNFLYIKHDIDWTSKGLVSPVKNQGRCGSCWAFSAVAVLESWGLIRGEIASLSEQQLIDCSFAYGNFGCEGGYNYKALKYVQRYGITTQIAYPYTAQTQRCKFRGGSFKISGVQAAIGCQKIQNAIQIRPIGVSADASNWSNYASGIFSDCDKNLNHNILLVGITSTYYKIKNSWGTSWGEQGFMRLALGDTCGICDDFSPWVQ